MSVRLVLGKQTWNDAGRPARTLAQQSRQAHTQRQNIWKQIPLQSPSVLPGECMLSLVPLTHTIDVGQLKS